MPIFSDSVLDQPSRFARYRGFLIFAAIFALLWFVVPPVIRYLPEFLPDPAVLQTETGSIRIVTMTERLNRPWGLAFLPEGDILVTELPGRLRRIHNGKLQGQIIPGVPKVETQDQAGLMDIALHPRFAENHLVYLTYSKIGPRGNTPALARARFDGTKLLDFRTYSSRTRGAIRAEAIRDRASCLEWTGHCT